MEEIICKGVELDYTNIHGTQKPLAVFDATIILKKDDDERWYISDAIAEETNETFGVEKGEHFDPGELDVQTLLSDFSSEKSSQLLGVTDIAEMLGWSKQRVHISYRRGKLPEPDTEVGGRPAWMLSTIEKYKEGGI